MMPFASGTDAAERRRFRPSEPDDIPPTPPAAVLAEVDAAFARAAELHASGRELHFALDAATRRLVLQVRTLGGQVVRTLPPSSALDFLCS